MKKFFLALLFFFFSINIFSQVAFNPFMVKGYPVLNFTHTGVNTYYFTSGHYLLRTTDYFNTVDTLFYHPTSAALSFSLDTTQSTNYRIIVYPFSLSSGEQEFYSPDGGSTWTPINGGHISKHVFAGNKLYALCDTSINLFCSVDTGQTWSQIALPKLHQGGDVHRNFLTTDQNNKIYVFSEERYVINYNPPTWMNDMDMWVSSDGGSSWHSLLRVSHDPIWWRIKRSGNYLCISPAANTAYIYNLNTAQMTTLFKSSDNSCVDNYGNIFLAKWDLPPGLRYIWFSNDFGASWLSYPISSYATESIDVDEYGFFYLLQDTYNQPNQKSLKSFYQYFSSDSLNVRYSPSDTNFVNVTIYNPLTRALPLDSISVISPFLVKNFFPGTLQPGNFITVEFGIRGTTAGNFSSMAKVYFGALSMDIKLQGQIISGVSEENEIREFTLSQNYPNPFNPNTTIKYSVPLRSLVQLKVFNMLGEQVGILVNEIKEKGNYSVEFSNSELTSGIYFYKLESAGYSKSMKMVFIK